MLLINNFMTIQEAADRWEISVHTLKNKLNSSKVGEIKLSEWEKSGLIKSYVKPGGKNKLWIITTEFMEMHYGKEPK